MDLNGKEIDNTRMIGRPEDCVTQQGKFGFCSTLRFEIVIKPKKKERAQKKKKTKNKGRKRDWREKKERKRYRN